MKLFIMLLMVALLAALCAAQPVDSSAPEQPDTTGVLRFKRDSFIIGSCPPGSIKWGGWCLPDNDDYSEETDVKRPEDAQRISNVN